MKTKPKILLKVTAVLAVSMLLLLAVTSCIRIVGLNLQGSGNVTTQDREISGVNSVSISAGMNLFITQGSTEELRIEAEDNIIPRIATEVRNGRLIIKFDNIIFGVTNKKPINVFLTIKDLKEINASSGASITSEGINTEELSVDLGSGAIGEIFVDVKNLDVEISSGAQLEISGKTENQKASLNSAGNYRAGELESKTAVVNLSSGAMAEINVSEKLDANVSSGASLRYIGSPEIISNISSGGELRSISE
ncbi:MAG: DUF2807 domain-containing protein [Actinobacteria bacterium]|nr:DUF2807 domain-containing protein [Actinomycetota bacterium]